MVDRSAARVNAIAREIQQRLTSEVDVAIIAELVEDELEACRGARVTDFITVLVSRRVCARLRSGEDDDRSSGWGDASRDASGEADRARVSRGTFDTPIVRTNGSS